MLDRVAIPETVLICGTGPSLQDLVDQDPGEFYTFGVNDIGRWFTPNHLVVSDQPGCFDAIDRRPWILNSQAEHFWVSGGWEHGPHAPERHRIPWQGVPDHYKWSFHSGHLRDEKVLVCLTTPFTCVGIAYKLGAKKIGLIGVDLGGHSQLEASANYLNYRFRQYATALEHYDVELVNCSPVSLLTNLERDDLESFRTPAV